MAGPIAGDVRESPLGRERDYAGGYDPSRLYPIARADSRSTLIAAPARGFHGVDWWTAFELSWLDGDGRPQVAVGRFAVPADSPCIVESKSLKLYLGGLYNVAYECWAALEAVLTADLSAAAGAPVGVTLESLAAFEARGFDRFLGICVDTAPLRQEAELLAAEGQETASVRQRFHSHLLRSLCPVTGQPDWGSVELLFEGPELDPAGVLALVLAQREHNGFHEATVERLYASLEALQGAAYVAVRAAYCRRGGIDITPCRASAPTPFNSLRLARQ
ncbi:MAG: NADPH-dependent 7-cyano-7-deazaguanine reductase QueF [Pseudomonadales bacterium]|nr:NADPH-dependent 7-cyano-7-deazaguanine reductase QueF [Pseudomonadales bacterium]